MNHLLILKSLLFMNFGEQMFADHVTQNCIGVTTGSNLGRCNRVCNVTAITDEDIISMQDYFGNTHFTWAVDCMDHATITVLEKNGLKHKAISPGMIINLDQINEPPINDRITIKEIESEEDLLIWANLVWKNYGYNQEELAKAVRFLRTRAQGMLKLYIGYYDTAPVATSMIGYHCCGMVSVHLVSTLADYRKKGLGTAVIGTPLLHARDLGSTHSILMTSSDGYSLAQKIGFKEFIIYKIYGNY